MSGAAHIMLVAGESSGDRLGAALMRALREEAGDVRFSGVGGAAMQAEGLDCVFPSSDIAVMGFAEVVPHIPRIAKRLKMATAAVADARPDALVTIDAQVFSALLAKRVKRMVPSTALVQYVAPTVWAWKPWRARKAALIYDRMLTLFPFEPPYFEREGLAADYVGHPVIERVASIGEVEKATLRQSFGIAIDAPVLLVAPGSRLSEIERLGAIFGDAAGLLAGRVPDLSVIVPVADAVADQVAQIVSCWPVPVHMLRSEGGEKATEARKFAAFAAADIALVASGTVSLEVAATGTPMVVAYRVPKSTEFMVRRLSHVDTFTLVNLMVGRKAIPELLQERCTAPRLAEALHEILQSGGKDQKSAFAEAFDSFGSQDAPPSMRAARGVMAAIASKQK